MEAPPLVLFHRSMPPSTRRVLVGRIDPERIVVPALSAEIVLRSAIEHGRIAGAAVEALVDRAGIHVFRRVDDRRIAARVCDLDAAERAGRQSGRREPRHPAVDRVVGVARVAGRHRPVRIGRMEFDVSDAIGGRRQAPRPDSIRRWSS